MPGVSVLDALLDSPVREAFTPSAGGQKFPRADHAALAVGGKPPAPRAPGAGAYDETKHKRAPAGAAGGGRFVASGSSGENVRAVQHRVGASPDGKFGQQTRQRVMDFQKRHGLKVDGVVGHQTALALAGHYREAKAASPGALQKSDGTHLRSIRKGGASRRPRTRRVRGGMVV